MWQCYQGEVIRSSYRESQEKTTVRVVSESYLLCYTRERVQRKEKEILQHPTTPLYIHFVCHPRIIPHAPMNHPNIFPWSYTLPTQHLITTTTPHRPMSQHLKPLPYHKRSFCHHLTTFSHHSHVYQHPHFSITLIPSIHPILYLSILQSITRYPSLDSIPL